MASPIEASAILYNFRFWLRAGVLAGVVLSQVAAEGWGQDPPAATSPAGQAEGQTATSENDAMLAKAAKLYYSTAREGLTGFTCAVHPDWYALVASAQPGNGVTRSDERIALLNTVKMTLHARMKGGTTLDWEPDASREPDAETAAMLESAHKNAEHFVLGVVQFWIPFVDGSAIPESSAGMEIAPAGGGYNIRSKVNGSEVKATLGSSLMLENFDVDLGDAAVKFAPSYQSTQKGLLATGFEAQVRPRGAEPGRVQVMNVSIQYKTVEGFPIPSQFNTQEIGTETFNFALDGCTVSREAR